MIATAALIALCACGRNSGDKDMTGAEKRPRAAATLDPHPPMSAQDIDAIVKQTTAAERAGKRRPGEPAAPRAAAAVNQQATAR